MPSLRQKVTTYFRQLSFIADPRDGPRSPRKGHADVDDDDGNFITKYLEGRMERHFLDSPKIHSGHEPTDLPALKIGVYATGSLTISAACTGPDEGLTGIKRSKLHLSASYADDIDFIDTIQESDCYEVRKSIATSARNHNKYGSRALAALAPRKLSNGGMTSGVGSDQNANKLTAAATGMRSRKNSKTSLSNLTAANKDSARKDLAAVKGGAEEHSKSTTIVVSMVVSSAAKKGVAPDASDQNNKNLLNAKTDSGTTIATTTTVATTTDSTGADGGVGDTTKLLAATTERLLREAVSNQAMELANGGGGGARLDAIAGVSDWKMESEWAYGISVSLYENNQLTKEPVGSPIADCYGMVSRGDAAVMALADGVNWGDGARLAARSAVHGCLDYLDRAIFGVSATTTTEVFVSLLRSLWEGHGCILEVGGALSTLTIAVVLPLANSEGRYVVCACNVGDSLGYVYSKQHGVREFTQASHDITSMRDMRDALGALGPADGNKPELSNLTLSLTEIERGDIVVLTSDGVSDNFDPVVGKFAEAWTPDVKLMASSAHGMRTSLLAPKRQNKSASAIYARLHGSSPPSAAHTPLRPPRTKKSTDAVPAAATAAPSRPKYLRSHTVIEPRRLSGASGHPHPTVAVGVTSLRHEAPRPLSPKIQIPKSIAGLPLVTGPQRHALTLYRLEDLLSYGINGTFSPCASARRVCHLLIDFVRMITAARRKTLEQRELFYKLTTGPDGLKREVELNRMQHRAARKRVVDSSAFAALPGKLDHATVMAYTAGGVVAASAPPIHNVSDCSTGSGGGGVSAVHFSPLAPLKSQEFRETNF